MTVCDKVMSGRLEHRQAQGVWGNGGHRRYKVMHCRGLFGISCGTHRPGAPTHQSRAAMASASTFLMQAPAAHGQRSGAHMGISTAASGLQQRAGHSAKEHGGAPRGTAAPRMGEAMSDARHRGLAFLRISRRHTAANCKAPMLRRRCLQVAGKPQSAAGAIPRCRPR